MVTNDELGPFGAEQGSPSTFARASVVIVAAAATTFVARIILEASRAGADERGLGRTAVYAGIAGFGAGLAGLYQVSTQAKRGRALANIGLVFGPLIAIAAFIHGAIRDGTFQPGKFGHTFLDRDVFKQIWPDLLRGMRITVMEAFTAQVLAVSLGLMFAVFVLSKRRWLHIPGVAYIDGVRGTPLVVLGLLLYFGLPRVGLTLSTFAAIGITLGINASAYVAEIFRAGIQSLPRGQTDAARSLGMPQGTTMLFVVIPQAVRAVVPPLMSEFIALVKDTAIVSSLFGATIAGSDIFAHARTAALSTGNATPFVGAALAYLIITVPLSRLVGRLERRARAVYA